MIRMRLLPAVVLLMASISAATAAEVEDFLCPSCGAAYVPWPTDDLMPPGHYALDGHPNNESFKVWVCPVCAYACPECARNARREPIDPAEAEAMHNSAYRAVLSGPYPEESKSLLLAAQLARARGRHADAARYTLRAVWACTDSLPFFLADGMEYTLEERGPTDGTRPPSEEEREVIAICRDLRERAVTRYEQALIAYPAAEPESERMYMSVVLVDLYRRTGAFARAETLCGVLLEQARKNYPVPMGMYLPAYTDTGRNLYLEVLRWQQTLIARKDTWGHRISVQEGVPAALPGG